MSKIKINKIKHVFCDMDGTLLNSEKKITQENIDMIKRLQERGIKFHIATGRPLQSVTDHHEKINFNSPFFLVNGAFVYNVNHNEAMLEFPIQPKIAKKLFVFLVKNEIPFLIYEPKYLLVNNPNNSKYIENSVVQVVDNKNLIFINKAFKFNENEHIVLKFLVMDLEISNNKLELLHEEINKYSDIYTVKSQYNLIDIMRVNVSKGNSIAQVCEKNNINLDYCVALGDASNDIEMLRLVKYSVAMGNATEQVKTIAKYETKSNNDSGVAHFFKNMVDWNL